MVIERNCLLCPSFSSFVKTEGPESELQSKVIYNIYAARHFLAQTEEWKERKGKNVIGAQRTLVPSGSGVFIASDGAFVRLRDSSDLKKGTPASRSGQDSKQKAMAGDQG